MPTYTPFSIAEIEAALPDDWTRAAPPVVGAYVREAVYQWDDAFPSPTPDVVVPGFLILCYSGIEAGTSRPCGEDAIRFSLYDMVSGRGLAHTKRVHRTGTVASLRKRMKDRFDEMYVLALEEERVRCKKCGAATVERVNKKTNETFRGCLRWKECKEAAQAQATPRSAYGLPPMPKVVDTDEVVNDAPSVDDPPPPIAIDAHDEWDTLDWSEDPDAPPAAPIRMEPEVRREPIVLTDPITDWEACSTTNLYPELVYPFGKFNPVQSAFLPYASDDVNVVVAAPTSAGKTVIAEIAIAETLARRATAVFLSPLKAVTQEKYDDWTGERFKSRRVSIVTGDYVLTEKRKAELAEAEIILMTSEMLDSRTRRMKQEKNAWLLAVRTLVCDEAHLLTVSDRGPALEAGIMRFTKQNPDARVILLSATMPNVEELGVWLTRLNGKQSVILRSSWRPVPSETTFVPHDDAGRYWDVETAKVGTAMEIIQEYGTDKFLAFVHTKATGRLLLRTLEEAGIVAEFHSADLSLQERLRIEGEFKRK